MGHHACIVYSTLSHRVLYSIHDNSVQNVYSSASRLTLTMRVGATSAVDTSEKCGKVQNSVILCNGSGVLSHDWGSGPWATVPAE